MHKFVQGLASTFLPKDWSLVDKRKLAEIFNSTLRETVEWILRGKENKFGPDLDFSNSIRHSGHRISVTSESDKKYLKEVGWFGEKEIDVTKIVGKVAESIAPVAANYQNNYREMNSSQVRLAQDACYARMKTDPIFQGAIRQLINYTIGNGVTTSTQVIDVDDVLDSFTRLNRFDENTSLEYRLVFRHFLEGEQFILCSVDSVNGDTWLNWIETYEISDWEFHPDNRDQVIAYQVNTGSQSMWIADHRYFDEVYNSSNVLLKAESTHHKELSPHYFIIHIKENLYPEFRGRPFATAALRYFKWAEDFLADRTVLNHERSRVVWVRTILGRAASNLANYLAAPPGGVMLNQTEDIKYDVMNAQINADNVKEDYLSIMYAIASCFLMPIHVLNMRAGEQVYSSVLSAKAPFTKAITTWQDFFGRSLTKIYRVVIREKLKARVLKSQYKITFINDNKELNKMCPTLDIPINHTFPNPVDEKLIDQTNHQKFMLEYDIASQQTVREKNGLDSKLERYRISQEKPEQKDMLALKMKGKQDAVGSSGEPTGSADRYSA
jgi:hypothetical protein